MILNIDTATETASIALSNETTVLSLLVNKDQKDHAAWIHTAIQQLLKDAGYTLKDLKAIAVTAGPGSYTGLRVGMATAKGLCYVLNIPLIMESTLKLMARAAIEHFKNTSVLFCPMIDARRMEVFTGVYDIELNEVMMSQPMVLNERSFEELLSEQQLIFFGSGSKKFQDIIRQERAEFKDVLHHAGHLSSLADTAFKAQKFTDPAYAEPVYLKEFYTHTRK